MCRRKPAGSEKMTTNKQVNRNGANAGASAHDSAGVL